MPHYILAVNPGSTSTKIGLFCDDAPIFTQTIEHDHNEIAQYPNIASQKDMRKNLVISALEEQGYSPGQLSAVVGRGGLFPPINTGGYIVTQKLKQMIINEEGVSPHASNLGALIADEIAAPIGIPAYIYDAVSAGHLPEHAKITGFPEIERQSFSHVLNCRAMAINYANSIDSNYDEMNFIIAHLGGGISIGAHKKGKIVDSIGDDYGTFSPERAGGAPLLNFLELCFDEKYTKKDIMKKIRGMGGLKAHLGTPDVREIEQMIEDGNERAKLILEAMCYNTAKNIASLLPALDGKCDAVILTGGVAKSKFVTEKIADALSFIGKIKILPGEYELEALAQGGLRLVMGLEHPSEI